MSGKYKYLCEGCGLRFFSDEEDRQNVICPKAAGIEDTHYLIHIDCTNVHTEHCCILHGCKYGYEHCPVVLGLQRQSFSCEECEEFNEHPLNPSLMHGKREKVSPERLFEIRHNSGPAASEEEARWLADEYADLMNLRHSSSQPLFRRSQGERS